MKPLKMLPFKVQNWRKQFKFEGIQQHVWHRWPSPVFFFYILPRGFVHHMDLDHGMWEQQLVLESVRPVDVNSQHKAVVKRWFLWCFRLDVAIFCLNWKESRNQNYCRNSTSRTFFDWLTVLFLLCFLFPLSLHFSISPTILAGIFIRIPIEPKSNTTVKNLLSRL